MRNLISVTVLIFAQLTVSTAWSSELRVAVASNFAATARELLNEYSIVSEDSIVLLVGSTGKHASQIRYGLGVDVFLAADSARPKYLEDNGFAIRGSRFTYAIGQLALWSNSASLVDASGEVLRSSNFKHLAIANPKTAPYGIAAKEVLTTLGISPTLVNGESVGQAFQFANSGGAELALVAFAQVRNLNRGSQWLVPTELHNAIEQQGVLLRESVAARNFMAFLRSEPALKLIVSNGYLKP